jgi:DNA polymerase elongation subunit (family B)
MTTSISNVSIKRKSKIIIHKQFRLVDFHIYEDVSQKEENETTSFKESNETNKNESIFIIQMFGINEQGETCSLSVNDFQPFFYVKVGDNWENQHAFNLLSYIRKLIGPYYESSILDAVLVEHNKLYGFSANKTHKFVKFVFKNTTTMARVKSLWFTPYSPTTPRKSQKFMFPPNHAKAISLELYESNIPPLLRYFHINNISPSGWVSIPISRVITSNIKTTTCTYEYICSASNIKAVPEKETRVPYKICSFDIEASSSHGDFPLPKKNYKRLAINIIDSFTLHAKTQLFEIEIAKQLFSKQILTAFGYSNFENIDLVYPKNKPSKQKVVQLITELLSHSFQTIQTSSSKDISDLLTIDSIFGKMCETSNSYTDDCDEDPDVNDISNINDDNEDNNIEDETPIVKRVTKISKPISKIKSKETIIDILLSTTYEREYKVQCMNEGLTLLFPQLEGDKTTFIGSTFLRYGDPSSYLNHCLVLGTCDDIEGVVVESVNTEKELLVKWTELIQRENPDIIIGYNIFGFDYEFLFQRALENQCEYEFLLLSRKINDLCAKKSKEGVLSIENSKIQLSTGEYDLRFFKMCGRVQIDLYAYFRRDFNLSSYKLDDVAGQFIGDSIKKIIQTTDINNNTNPNITELYSQNLMGLNIGDFIHIELSSFTTDYYKNGKKFKVLNIIKDKVLIETGQIYNVIIIEGPECLDIDVSKSIRWGMAKDDVSPQDIFRLSNGTSSDRAIVGKYCIQDCNLVHHLMNKIDILTGFVEMSRICSVPISFLVFRGQGIKLTSYVAKKCREKNTLMPDLERIEYADGYEGAIVLPPKCSMYMDNPVACVDYSSLYPSAMISQNLSHDSKVWTKEYNLQGKLIFETGDKDQFGNYKYDNMNGYSYIDLEFDTFKYIRNPEKPTAKAEKTKSGKIVCRWAQFPDNRKGIMPSILEELLKARADTRKMIKTETDPFIQNILDKRQLGYKTTANSLYGQCGSRTSTFYEKDVAASTTATGRMMIIYAKRIIEEVYSNMIYETTLYGNVKCNAEYIYGDTDSVFFTFNLENPETGEKIKGKRALEITIEIAQDAAKLCTQYLKPPMELSYEKTLMPFILLSKKRYVGMLYETDANKGKLKYMGLSLKRRDSCDYLKDTYGGVLNILMKENNINQAIQFLESSLNNLIAGIVPMDKLTITKALRSDYKKPHQIAHKVLADRIGQRDPGNKPKSGDRIKFIHITHSNNKALQGEKIETPEYIIANRVLIDYSFYITNQIMKPLQQLFGLAVEQIWEYKNKKSAIKKFNIDMNNLHKECNYDLEVFMKKKEKYCSDVIKILLFDSLLIQINNAKNKQQPITNLFKRTVALNKTA